MLPAEAMVSLRAAKVMFTMSVFPIGATVMVSAVSKCSSAAIIDVDPA